MSDMGNNPINQTILRPLYRQPPEITHQPFPNFTPMRETPNQIIKDLQSQGILNITQGLNGQNSLSLNKPLSSLSQNQIDQLNNALGFKITNQNIQQSRDETDLQNSGIITVNNDKLSLNKPLYSLSSNDIAKLNNLGFNITAQQIAQAKNENDLESSGIIKVDNGKATLNKPLSSLSSDQIKQLNDLGFNITQSQVTESQDLSDLESSGIITQSGDNLQLNTSLDKLTPDQISKLNTIGFNITQSQINQAKTEANLQLEATELQSRGIVNIEGDKVTLNKPLSSLSSSDITKLKDLGFNITQDEISTAQTIANLQTSGIIKVDDNGNMTLLTPVDSLTSKQISDLKGLGFTSEQLTPIPTPTSTIPPTASQLQSAGIITINNGTMSVNKPLYTLTRQQMQDLSNLGFNITQDQMNIAQVTSYLLSQKVISINGNQINIIKPISSLTQGNINELKQLGFTDSQLTSKSPLYAPTGPSPYTTVLSPQEITAIQQQAINTLTSKGIITAQTHLYQPTGTSPYSTGQQQAYIISKPLATLSDVDIQTLQQAGFQLSSTQLTQRVEAQILLSNGVLKASGNSLTLAKPVTALTDADIDRLRDIGISVPNLPKNPSQSLYEAGAVASALAPLGGKIPVIGGAVQSAVSSFGKTLEAQSGVLGDVVNTLVSPIQLFQEITPNLGKISLGNGMSVPTARPNLTQGLSGPTTGTLKYYMDLTPVQQAALTAEGTVASLAAGYIEFLPVGIASDAVVSKVASGLASKIAASETATEIATKLQAVRSSLGVAASKVPVLTTSMSVADLADTLTALMKNPKFQQAIVWGGMAGYSSYEIYQKLATGMSIDDVIEQEAPVVAGQFGQLAGMMDSLGVVKGQGKNMANLVRLTGGDIKITPEGEIETPFTQMKQVPKQLKDIYDLEIDQATGKVKVIGTITKINGKDVVIPIIREYNSADIFNMLKDGKVVKFPSTAPESAEEALYQKVVEDKLTSNDVKTVLVKYFGEDGYSQILQSIKNDELLKMSPQEVARTAIKELSDPRWQAALQDFEKDNPFLLPSKDLHIEYIGTISSSAKIKIPEEIDTMLNKLKSLGLSHDEASYWVSQIMTKDPATVARAMENIKAIRSVADKQDLAKIISDYNVSQIEHGSITVDTLKSANLNQSQIQNVIQSLAMSDGNPEAFVKTLTKMDSQSAATTLQMISKDQLTSAMSGINPTELTKIVESASNINPLLIASMTSVMTSNVLADVLDNISTSSLSKIVQNISSNNLLSAIPYIETKSLSNTFNAMTPEQLNSVLTNISAKDLSNIFLKISPNDLSKIVSSLDTNQLSTIIPKLDETQIQNILQILTPEQIQQLKNDSDLNPTLSKIFSEPLPVGPLPLLPKNNKLLSDNSQQLFEQTQIFEVKLTYSNNHSQTYKVQAKSFHGAANQALSRRTTSQLPIDIKVTIKYNNLMRNTT